MTLDMKENFNNKSRSNYKNNRESSRKSNF